LQELLLLSLRHLILLVLRWLHARLHCRLGGWLLHHRLRMWLLRLLRLDHSL
jgi:hypothetical protein